MRAYIGITDGDWYRLLAATPGLEEVNFWQPGGSRVFSALHPGELFLFKLHSPHDYVVGGGVFTYSTLLPISLAWSIFREANGAKTFEDMRACVAKHRQRPHIQDEDYIVGCILLSQPFFFREFDWIDIPSDWPRSAVQGKSYDLTIPPGNRLFDSVQRVLSGSKPLEPSPSFGKTVMVQPRLGQGSFRILVTDIYDRCCAASGARVLPVLEAAHIRPYTEGGLHQTDNGILLRSDLHTLLDRGYLTITPEHKIEISRRIKEEFDNGKDYYALHGHQIKLPRDSSHYPSA